MKLYFFVSIFCVSIKTIAQDTAAIFSKLNLDRGVHLHRTKANHFVTTGITTPSDNNADGLVVNYSEEFKLQWSKNFGGANYDFLWGIAETQDKGFIITGFTNSYGNGAFDCWIIRLNTHGDTIWTKTFGGTGDDRAISVIPTSDGNFAVVGQTSSWGAGNNDVLLFKISGKGEILWYKTVGQAKSDRGFYIMEAANRDLIISGITENNPNNDIDAFIIRTTTNGDTIWTKKLGCKGGDVAHSLMSDKNKIVIGGYREYKSGVHQPWLFKLNEKGNLIEERVFKAEDDTRIIGAYLNDKGEVIGTGYTKVSPGSDWNMFFMKYSKKRGFSFKVYPMPQDDQGYGICEYKKGHSIAVGHSLSTRNKDGDLVLWTWQH